MSFPPKSLPAVSPLSSRSLEAVAPVESYQALLELMAPGEPVMAAERFHWLRTKVLRFFAWRGERNADQLADEVLSRLARKVAEEAVTTVDELPAYALGIARRVYSESLRWQSRRSRDLAALAHREKPQSASKDFAKTLDQVEQCLATLDCEDQHLLLSYYEGDGGERIRCRRQLAKRLGISMSALRLRIFRIRRRVAKCLERLTGMTESGGVKSERADR